MRGSVSSHCYLKDIFMDVWMLSRKGLKKDLLDIFAALDNIHCQYDWIISDHDMWYDADCPETVKMRWQWTGLLISGDELAAHYSAGYVWFCSGGILSAVPFGTKQEQVWNNIPCWAADFEDPQYRFQTPLTELEIICYDGYAWLIVCKPELSTLVRKNLPQALPPKQWYLEHTRTRTDKDDNKISVIDHP